jgi:hypothetical protein
MPTLERVENPKIAPPPNLDLYPAGQLYFHTFASQIGDSEVFKLVTPPKTAPISPVDLLADVDRAKVTGSLRLRLQPDYSSLTFYKFNLDSGIRPSSGEWDENWMMSPAMEAITQARDWTSRQRVSLHLLTKDIALGLKGSDNEAQLRYYAWLLAIGSEILQAHASI